MNNALRWATRLALFLTALVVLGTGVAAADETTADVQVPVDPCGIGVGVLGSSSADCGDTAAPAEPAPTEPAPAPAPAAPAEPAPSPAESTVSDDSVLGDVDVSVQVPVDVCGVGVAVAGSSSADCGGSAPAIESAPPASESTDGDAALLGDVIGDVDVDAQAPVGACGVGVAVRGSTPSDCSGAAATAAPSSTPPLAPSTSQVGNDTVVEDVLGYDLVGDIDVDAQAPVGVCGVGVGVLGSSSSDCSVETVAAGSGNTDDPTDTTDPSAFAGGGLLPMGLGNGSSLPQASVDRLVSVAGSVGAADTVGQHRSANSLAVTGLPTAALMWFALLLILAGLVVKGLSRKSVLR